MKQSERATIYVLSYVSTEVMDAMSVDMAEAGYVQVFNRKIAGHRVRIVQ